MSMIDPLATSKFSRPVKPIPKERFSHVARATSDTSKHDEVHDSGYFISYRDLNGISMR